jgi:glyoxylase-like metal-dependent hydrolase (beta-lactamase superfamily II)
MKNLLLTSVLSFLLFAPAISEEGPAPIKLTENLYVATGMWCNATFFVAEDQVYVFDCGWDLAQGEMLDAQIKQVTDKKVKTLVYTHFHRDHAFGAFALPPNIEIIAQENLVANLKKEEESLMNHRDVELPGKIKDLEKKLAEMNSGDSAYSKITQELQSIKNELTEEKRIIVRYPTITFKDTFEIKTKSEVIRLIYPGNAHTNDNCVVEFQNANTIYLGDILFSNCYPNIGWDAGADLENWKKLLAGYANREFSHYIPGHCEMASSGDLLLLAAYLTDMQIAVGEKMKEGKTLDEIKSTMEKLDKYSHFGLDFLWYQNIEAFYGLLNQKQ